METIELEYKGYVITHQRIPLMSSMYTVNLASNDRQLMAQLGFRTGIFTDHHSFAGAIEQAKCYVDGLQ